MSNYNGSNQSSKPNQSDKKDSQPSGQPNKGANQQQTNKTQNMAQSNVGGGASKPSQTGTNQSGLGNKNGINKGAGQKEDQKKRELLTGKTNEWR